MNELTMALFAMTDDNSNGLLEHERELLHDAAAVLHEVYVAPLCERSLLTHHIPRVTLLKAWEMHAALWNIKEMLNEACQSAVQQQGG